MKLYPVIKVDQYAKRGDFKGRGAEKSPYSWCWLDLTRKKVQIVVKRLPAQYWPVLHYCKSCCFNWAGLWVCLCWAVSVRELQPLLDRIKGTSQKEGEPLPAEDCNNQHRMTENESHHQPQSHVWCREWSFLHGFEHFSRGRQKVNYI